MPLVRIDLLEGKPEKYRTQIGQIVYQAMLDVLGVPKNDRFQIITEHPKSGLQFDREYLGIHRSDDCIFLQITLNSGRTVEAAFLQSGCGRIARNAERASRGRIHQPGRSVEGKLVLRQWRSSVCNSLELEFPGAKRASS